MVKDGWLQGDVAMTETTHKHGLVLHGAAFYDFTVWAFTLGREHVFRDKILARAGVKEGERVLDVGCGTGSLAIAAKQRVGPAGSVSGLDASPEMLARARKKAAKAGLDVSFREGIVQNMPFPDSSFDLALSSVMLHHLSRSARQLCANEMRRVVKPGGRVMAVDFSKPTSRHGVMGHLHRHGHVELGEIETILREAGLTIMESGKLGFKNTQFVMARREYS